MLEDCVCNLWCSGSLASVERQRFSCVCTVERLCSVEARRVCRIGNLQDLPRRSLQKLGEGSPLETDPQRRRHCQAWLRGLPRCRRCPRSRSSRHFNAVSIWKGVSQGYQRSLRNVPRKRDRNTSKPSTPCIGKPTSVASLAIHRTTRKEGSFCWRNPSRSSASLATRPRKRNSKCPFTIA